MKDDWTNDIRRLMTDYEAQAPKGLLEEVKKQLPPEKQAKAKITPLWRYRWIAAAAAVALIAAPVSWKLLTGGNEKIAVVSKKTSIQSPKANNNKASNNDKENATLPGNSSVANAILSYIGEKEGSLRSQYLDNEAVAGEVPMQEIASASDNQAQAAAPKESAESRKVARKQKPGTRNNNASQYDDYAYTTSYKSKGGALSFGAFYGAGGVSNSNGTMDNNVILSDAAPIGQYSADMLTSNNKVALGKEERKAHHNLPVKVGVSVGYRLNDRWSVRSGVTYSYLSSDFTSEHEPKQTQKLHYIGIPLSASYSVVKSKKVDVYVTAGGEAQKLVSGTRKTEGLERSSESLSEKRMQWSVNAAVGASYQFAPSMSVYVEPGVTRYFDNHSTIVNTYKDKPTAFSLNMGVRVNLEK